MTVRQVIDAIERRTRGPYRGADQARRLHEHQQIAEYRRAMAELASGPAAAHAFDAYMQLLFGLHRDGASFIDWVGLLAVPAPRPPTMHDHNQRAATEAAARYVPDTFDQLSGRAKARKQELARAIEHARVLDARLFEQVGMQYSAEASDWRAIQTIVPRIIERDANLYGEILQHTGLLALLEPFGTRVVVTHAASEFVTLTLVLQADKVIPDVEIGISAWGNSTAKKLTIERRWQLLTHHACSSALRVAADALQILPITEVLVHAGTGSLSSSTGRVELTHYLSLRCPRSTMERLNLHAIDPVDALVNFEHRIQIDRTAGLLPIEPLQVAKAIPQRSGGR